MSAFYREKVLSVHHWTDTLFSFRATRDSGFRFQNGQFAMIGLEVDGRPLLRASRCWAKLKRSPGGGTVVGGMACLRGSAARGVARQINMHYVA